jgi:SNF2 family DNA or RNA helicase
MTMFAPYPHQIAGASHIRQFESAAIMADPGVGKTKMLLDAICPEDEAYVVVFCPVSVKINWSREVNKHIPGWGHVHVLGSKKKLLDFMSEGYHRQILIVGIESMSSGGAYDLLKHYTLNIPSENNSWFVVDESHMIKNHSAKRTRRITIASRHYKRRITMTGTPTSGKHVDLFAQFRMLDPGIFGTEFGKFRGKYCIMGGYEGREIIGYQNLGDLQKRIDPITYRCRKEDCLDLPPKIYQTRFVRMAPEQKRAYKFADQMLTVAMSDISCGIKNALEKLLRCQQITSGILRSGDQEEDLPAPKIRELMNLIEGIDGKVVIWSAFRGELERIVKELESSYPGQTVVVHGGIPPNDKDAAVDAIQNGDARFYVGTAAAGGIGINLTAAHTEVFMSNSQSAIQRIQAEDRCHRSGQDLPVTIIDIVCEDSIDELVTESLKNKKDLVDGVIKGSMK